MAMSERNTRHSARLDDEMAAESASLTHGAPVEAHAEEWVMAEPPADGERDPESVLASVAEPAAGALDDDERRRRSQLAIALPPHAFPGDRGELLHAAEREHAEPWVLELVGTLPIDTRFDTVQDVWTALGGHRESRESGAEPAPEVGPVSAAEDVGDVFVREPEPEPVPEPSLPSPPPGIDLVGRASSLAGFGVGIASAVVGGTFELVRRVVLAPLRRR